MVTDPNGNPLENALVVVFQANMKIGHHSPCPTCYPDCAKWALTGPDGKYTISGLDPNLIFAFAVAKNGYWGPGVWGVDPMIGPQPAILRPRPAVKDDLQILRGRVLDTQGKPLTDALVHPWIGAVNAPGGRLGVYAGGLNGLVVLTNGNGEFEIAADRPFLDLTIRVTAQGKPPQYFTVTPSAERRTFTIMDGVTIRGRLVYDGKPVAAAELRLISLGSGYGHSFPDVRTKTAPDGRFAISNVPPGHIWLLAPTIESLAARGIGSKPIVCHQVKSDGQDVDLGDIPLKPAHTLSGKVVLVDGKTIPSPMQVAIVADRSRETQVVTIGSDGAFHFQGLPDGIYTIWPSVKGYRLVDECSACGSIDRLVRGEVNDLVLKMEPDPVDLARK